MSKRILALLCVLALIVTCATFTSCSKNKKVEYDGISIEEQRVKDSADTIVLVIKNKNKADKDVTITVDFYDDDDNKLDTKELSIIGFGKGATVAKKISCPDGFASCEYEVDAESSEDYVSMDKDIKAKVSKKKGGAYFSITNKGKYKAEEISYVIAYYKGGKLVAAHSGMCDDSLIPGNVYNGADNNLVPFDSVKIYAHAYRSE